MESPNLQESQNTTYIGMFEYKQLSESLIFKILINGKL